jgi:S1-C subfamily serine protease
VLAVPQELPVLPIAPLAPGVGTPLWTVGNAAGAIALDGHPARSRGTLSGVYDLPGGPVRGRGGRVLSAWRGPVWEVDAAVNEGLQGGAVVDEQGRLVALVTLAVSRERRLGCVVPWSALAAEAGLPVPVATTPAAAPPWLAVVALQRPQAPPAPTRPARTIDEVPPYEREDLQRQWDAYWHVQQLGRTDQPVPALVVDPARGHLLTAAGNLHGGAVAGIATLAGGGRVTVRVRAVDLPLELALLEAPGPLPGMAPGWSRRPASVGDAVTILGTHGTRTAGAVSAVGRRLAQAVVGFLQLAARAKFGSLGGVAVDAAGDPLGLVVHLGPEQPWLINSGVTLAVDGPTIAAALPALVAGTSRERLPILGLGVQLREEDGVMAIVAVVPGTGAAEAGLQAGDLLQRVADRPATSRAAIARALVRVTPGTAVPVVVRRGAETLTVPVTVRNFGD